eukprot:Skav204431  [mRNA]  locus=scaffold1093:32382:38282:- [translate_table: standard]
MTLARNAHHVVAAVVLQDLRATAWTRLGALRGHGFACGLLLLLGVGFAKTNSNGMSIGVVVTKLMTLTATHRALKAQHFGIGVLLHGLRLHQL